MVYFLKFINLLIFPGYQYPLDQLSEAIYSNKNIISQGGLLLLPVNQSSLFVPFFVLECSPILQVKFKVIIIVL